MTLMQEKFCFGRVRVSVFVRFAFARLGSAPLGSGRLGAREESSRDFMFKKIRHGRVLKWFLTPWRNLYSVLELLKLAWVGTMTSYWKSWSCVLFTNFGNKKSAFEKKWNFF